MKYSDYIRMFWNLFDLSRDPSYIIPNAVQCIAISKANIDEAYKPDEDEVARAQRTIATAIKHGAITRSNYETALRYWGLAVDPCNCSLCSYDDCPHRNAHRRLPRCEGGLGLCEHLENH